MNLELPEDIDRLLKHEMLDNNIKSKHTMILLILQQRYMEVKEND